MKSATIPAILIAIALSAGSPGVAQAGIPELPTKVVQAGNPAGEIVLDPNGGALPVGASQVVSHTGKVPSLATPAKTGYTFEGWYTDPVVGSKLSKGSKITQAGTSTFYAHWKAESLTVKFNAQKGTVSPKSKKYIYDSSYGTLPVPKRNGYLFTGWYSDPTVSTTRYADDTTVRITANSTFYAHWSAAVRIDSISGQRTTQVKGAPLDRSMGFISVSFADGSKTNIPLSDSGVSLSSFKPKTLGVQDLNVRFGDASNQVAWQVTVKEKVPLHFDLNGGTGSVPESILFSHKMKAPALVAPTYLCHSFQGWYTELDGGKRIVKGTAISLPGVSTLYAHWTANSSCTRAEVYYVSPDGDDENSGGINAPLKSWEGIRDRIRSIKEDQGLPEGGITVYFRGGRYPLAQTVWFDEWDSGSERSPITYAAYPGETPVFTGGEYIGAASLAPASGELAERISPEVRSDVYMANLYENGFTREDLDYDDVEESGQTFAVFVGGHAMYPARYPNRVPGLYAENPYNDYIYIEDGGSWIDGGPVDLVEHPAFAIPQQLADRMAGWGSYDEVLLSGMLSRPWYHEKTYLYGFNQTARTITLNRNTYDWDERGDNFGKYFFENVLDELDTPGEYYVDKESGMLYFYPPQGTDMDGVELKIPKLRSYLVQMRNTSWLTLASLGLELGRNTGVSIEGGSHVTVDGCHIANIGGNSGITVGSYAYGGWMLAKHFAEQGRFQEDEPSPEQNGLFHTVKNSTIRNIGGFGAVLHAGRVSTRESGHLLFENNVVLHTGVIDYWGGVDANGVGIRLLRNTVKFAPGFGMGLNGPDGEVAYNLICDVVSDPGQNDSSALGLHNGQIAWGLSVHDNFIRDIQQTPAREWEAWTHPRMPIRLAMYVDGYAPGAEITRNVVYNAPIGMSMPDNETFPSTYANNIFVDTMLPVQAFGLQHLEDYRHVTIKTLLSEETSWHSEEIYNTGIYKTAWKKVYPEYSALFEYLLKKKDLTQPMSSVYNNVSVNMAVPRVYVEPGSRWGPIPSGEGITPDPTYGRLKNNPYLDYDPGFEDYANGDIQLSKEAATLLGIEWVDLSRIGARALD
jgi:uncharacterized repeat protein (TIGR02543 family)